MRTARSAFSDRSLKPGCFLQRSMYDCVDTALSTGGSTIEIGGISEIFIYGGAKQILMAQVVGCCLWAQSVYMQMTALQLSETLFLILILQSQLLLQPDFNVLQQERHNYIRRMLDSCKFGPLLLHLVHQIYFNALSWEVENIGVDMLKDMRATSRQYLHVSPCLPHHPHRRPLHRIAPQRTDDERILLAALQLELICLTDQAQTVTLPPCSTTDQRPASGLCTSATNSDAATLLCSCLDHLTVCCVFVLKPFVGILRLNAALIPAQEGPRARPPPLQRVLRLCICPLAGRPFLSSPAKAMRDMFRAFLRNTGY